MKQGPCDICKQYAWTNTMYIPDAVEMCADCYDKSNILRGPPPPGDSGPWRFNDDPWQQNALRALEGE